MPDILRWTEIQDDFRDRLLLGNGSSMAIHRGFGYESLFRTAVDHGHITQSVAEIFRQFRVNDFEVVLRKLWHTKLVLQALDIPFERVEEAYLGVRRALIATVRDAHISYADAEEHLPHIYRFMRRFNTVISLNYDLIVYWAAMLANREGRWFKDGFIDGAFADDWERLRAPIDGARGSTLYFYPHGNLALTRTRGGESKVATWGGITLLESILRTWEAGNAVPLFVCEGTTEHKKRSIKSSSYLQRVFSEVLPGNAGSLVIYGWSMSEQDQHVLDQLYRRPPARVAVSVRNNNQDFAVEAERILEVAGVREIVFFDSASAGCWNNPAPINPRQ